MPQLAPLRDILVVLPGIAGSTLHHHGKPLWEPTLGAVRGILLHPAKWADAMSSRVDLLDDPEAPLEVSAQGIISTARVLPGLAKLNPYHGLRKAIAERFDIVPGDPKVDGPPANYFEFAYDWRRDNRIAAAQLKTLVDRERPKWQSTLASGQTRVILIAHSMGGLVSKYYLDVLGGWDTCRALMTFGTPFRGSVKALNFLANGFRFLGADIGLVTEVLRSLTPVYQLLPGYAVIRPQNTTGPLVKVSELDTPVGGLSLPRVQQAYAFQREIIALHHPERIAPVMGFGLPTLQSAQLTGNELTVSDDPAPLNLTARWLASGDSTVPAISAIPVGYPEHLLRTWANASHATMHSTAEGLDLVTRFLDLVQAGLDDFQDLESPPPAAASLGGPAKAVLTVHVRDLYQEREPIDVSYASTDPTDDLAITLTTSDGQPVAGDRWVKDGLPAGTYEVFVTGRTHTVSDIFEVI